MSRLESQLPLQVKPMRGPSILESKGRAMQLADLMAQREEQAQMKELRAQQIESAKVVAEQNKLENDLKRQKMEEDNNIRTIFNESKDTLTALEAVTKQYPQRGLDFTKEYQGILTAEAARRKTELDNITNANKITLQALSSLKSDPSEDNKKFILGGLASAGLFTPDDEQDAEMISAIQSFDPNNPESVQMIDGKMKFFIDFTDSKKFEKEDFDRKIQEEINRLKAIETSTTTKDFVGPDGKTMHRFTMDPKSGQWVDKGPVIKEDSSISETELALRAAQGDAQAKAALELLKQQKAAGRSVNTFMLPAETGMSPEINDALGRATMTMPQTRRNQVISTVKAMADRGDEAKVRETIRQAALESEPVATRQQVNGRREVVKSLQDIGKLLEEVPQNLLVGSLEDVVRKLGTSTNTKYVDISNRLKILNQSYRRSMTGAQFSIPEAKEYASIFPSYSNTAPLNKALIASLTEAFKSNDKSFWDNKLGQGWSDFDNINAKPAESIDQILDRVFPKK